MGFVHYLSRVNTYTYHGPSVTWVVLRRKFGLCRLFRQMKEYVDFHRSPVVVDELGITRGFAVAVGHDEVCGTCAAHTCARLDVEWSVTSHRPTADLGPTKPLLQDDNSAVIVLGYRRKTIQAYTIEARTYRFP